jgi:hypothetical protein
MNMASWWNVQVAIMRLFLRAVAAYLLIGLYVALVVVFGGIAKALIARQRRWLAALVLVSIIPTGIEIAIGGALIPDIPGALGLSRIGKFAAWLLLPVLVTLAYAIARILRPVAPPTARQPLTLR